ncbi:Hypothetical_protein [Hexamita inflata]|uniref:Hypothetical_protein n=1 Tax=Hexamita inflata TaxID=28002 RepID=A0AA86RDN6_9EUKA|nr:Hypothetical protein HINF_LOCUS7353 [Hexamita inflata]CAI9972096.1 Hypothetical protein HINF_LOCUS59741 [Hexamita inflata]
MNQLFVQTQQALIQNTNYKGFVDEVALILNLQDKSLAQIVNSVRILKQQYLSKQALCDKQFLEIQDMRRQYHLVFNQAMVMSSSSGMQSSTKDKPKSKLQKYKKLFHDKCDLNEQLQGELEDKQKEVEKYQKMLRDLVIESRSPSRPVSVARDHFAPYNPLSETKQIRAYRRSSKSAVNDMHDEECTGPSFELKPTQENTLKQQYFALQSELESLKERYNEMLKKESERNSLVLSLQPSQLKEANWNKKAPQCDQNVQTDIIVEQIQNQSEIKTEPKEAKFDFSADKTHLAELKRQLKKQQMLHSQQQSLLQQNQKQLQIKENQLKDIFIKVFKASKTSELLQNCCNYKKCLELLENIQPGVQMQAKITTVKCTDKTPDYQVKKVKETPDPVKMLTEERDDAQYDMRNVRGQQIAYTSKNRDVIQSITSAERKPIKKESFEQQQQKNKILDFADEDMELSPQKISVLQKAIQQSKQNNDINKVVEDVCLYAEDDQMMAQIDKIIQHQSQEQAEITIYNQGEQKSQVKADMIESIGDMLDQIGYDGEFYVNVEELQEE